MAHLAYYRAMERAGVMKQIRTRKDLQQHLDCWNFDTQRTPFGYILSMECADLILDPGPHPGVVRSRPPRHRHHALRPNRYGGGTGTEVGLQPAAKPIAEATSKRSASPLDLTHLSDPSFWQAAEWFNGRVLASHQNARKFCRLAAAVHRRADQAW